MIVWIVILIAFIAYFILWYDLLYSQESRLSRRSRILFKFLAVPFTIYIISNILSFLSPDFDNLVNNFEVRQKVIIYNDFDTTAHFDFYLRNRQANQIDSIYTKYTWVPTQPFYNNLNYYKLDSYSNYFRRFESQYQIDAYTSDTLIFKIDTSKYSRIAIRFYGNNPKLRLKAFKSPDLPILIFTSDFQFVNSTRLELDLSNYIQLLVLYLVGIFVLLYHLIFIKGKIYLRIPLYLSSLIGISFCIYSVYIYIRQIFNFLFN